MKVNMRRLVLLLLLALGFGVEVWAQKGMSSIGVDIPVGIGKHNVWTGVGIKYQYNISDFIRIEPSFQYFPIHSSNRMEIENRDMVAYTNFQAFLNGLFFVQSPKSVRPFFMIGAGFMQLHSKMYNYYYTEAYYSSPIQEGSVVESIHDVNDDLINIDMGIGLDIRLSYMWSLQCKVLSIIPITKGDLNVRKGRVLYNVSIGLSYNF